MEKADCIFFIESTNDTDRVVRASCLECASANQPQNPMYWPGSSKGYGPFTYICNFCKKIIHEHGVK